MISLLSLSISLSLSLYIYIYDFLIKMCCFLCLTCFIECRSTVCSVVKCGYGFFCIFFFFYFLLRERDSRCFCNLWNKTSFQIHYFFAAPSSVFFAITFGPKLTGQFHVLLVVNFIP
ncbi:hypothetical protein AMTRI_Chr01g128640 [Amborella trichopoda]